MRDETKREIEMPDSSFDRWLIGTLIAIGLLTVLAVFAITRSNI